MDRYTQKGDKVKYLGINGYTEDREAVEKAGITKGQTLVIESLTIDKDKVFAKFEGYEGYHRSVMFGDVQ